MIEKQETVLEELYEEFMLDIDENSDSHEGDKACDFLHVDQTGQSEENKENEGIKQPENRLDDRHPDLNIDAYLDGAQSA